jgi:DNA-binding NarL/FixJ family response regulator
VRIVLADDHHVVRRGPGLVLEPEPDCEVVAQVGDIASARAWVHQLPLPATAREQIAVGLAVIDAIELQLAPVDRELCS